MWLFLDSGAHTLYNIHSAYKKKITSGYNFYDSDEFWEYVNTYAHFVKKNHRYFTLCANVDVIFNPERSCNVQKYLRDRNIDVLPVVHYGTPVHWLDRYVRMGYTYIALGGAGQEVSPLVYFQWADQIFFNSKYKGIKFHGFAATSFPIMKRYPWTSLDSTTWITQGGYGNVYFPKWRNGAWDYSDPIVLACTPRRMDSIPISSKTGSLGINLQAIQTKTPTVYKKCCQYLEEMGITLDELYHIGKIRYDLNGVYFLRFMEQCQKVEDFVLYFAGVGRRAEESEYLRKMSTYNRWGVLISYYHTHHLLVNKKESARFTRLKRMIENES
jgi:hypothetical protein